MATVALLANPRAGRGRGGRLAGPVREALAAAGLRVLVLSGESGAESVALATDAVGTGVDAVVAVGWPVTQTGCDGIVAFVGATDVDVRAARARLRAQLPSHMLPRRLELLEALPLNASGKFDRRSLAQSLEDERSR